MPQNKKFLYSEGIIILSRMKNRFKYLPELKKKAKSFILDEQGSISKQKLVTVGSFLGSISLLSMLPEVSAGHANHSNAYTINWNSGTYAVEHGHHASHASHADHSQHAQHGSHGSHSQHGSHGAHSSHGQHGSHGSHSSHESHGSHASHSSCGAGMCCINCPRSGPPDWGGSPDW